MPQPRFATAEQIERVRDRLTSDDARFWFDLYADEARRVGLITNTSLAAFRAWAEAEGMSDVWGREIADLQRAGEPIPSQLVVEKDGKKIQGLGVETLFGRSRDRADRLAERMGFDPASITKIRVSRMDDLFGEDVNEGEEENVSYRLPRLREKLEKLKSDGLVAG